MNGSIRIFESNKDKTPLYWLHSLVLVVLVSYGGGAIAPILIGKPSVILANDVIIPSCIICWYSVHYLGLYPILSWMPIKIIWTIILGLFRTNTVCNIVKTASTTLIPGPYYPIPLVGPILAGTLLGSLGSFFPLDQGLSCIMRGTPWPMQAAFISAAFYHLMVHDLNGPLGHTLRCVVGTYSEPQTRVILASLQVFTLVQQVAFSPEANPFAPLHKLLYLTLQVRGPAAVSPKPDVGWAPAVRWRFERFLDVLRALIALLVVVTHTWSYYPPSSRALPSPFPPGDALGYCQMFPAFRRCTPYHLLLESVPLSPEMRASLSVPAKGSKSKDQIIQYVAYKLVVYEGKAVAEGSAIWGTRIWKQPVSTARSPWMLNMTLDVTSNSRANWRSLCGRDEDPLFPFSGGLPPSNGQNQPVNTSIQDFLSWGDECHIEMRVDTDAHVHLALVAKRAAREILLWTSTSASTTRDHKNVKDKGKVVLGVKDGVVLPIVKLSNGKTIPLS